MVTDPATDWPGVVERLRRRRDELGVGRRKLMFETGLDDKTLGNWECMRTEAKMADVFRWAEALGLKMKVTFE